MKLTDATCKAAKPTDKIQRIYDGQGLYLEIHPTGAKYWRFKYRYGNKDKRLALGTYPEISLKGARDLKDEARQQVARGLNPAFVRKEQKLLARHNVVNNFEALAREWHENWKLDKTKKHADALLCRFERDVFPHVGMLPVSAITPPMILEIVRQVEARMAYDVARRVKQTMGQIFRYGVATGRAERDPTADIREAMRPYKIEHYPALTVKELPEFFQVLEKNEMRLYHQTRLAMRFLAYTFVRTSEMNRCTWSEIDFFNKEWIIPAEKMKMRRDHLVPLSRQVLTILEELKEMNGHREWVFPNQVRPRNHMSNATILRAIDRMGYKDRMCGHGFRALAMTGIKERLGYRHEVVDRQLAHAHRNTIVAAYDRALFIEDRKKMMQEWADFLDDVATRSETTA